MVTSSTEATTDTTINNVVEISNEDASSETSEEIASVLNKIHADINTIIRKMDIVNFVIYILGVNTAINLINNQGLAMTIYFLDKKNNSIYCAFEKQSISVAKAA